MRGSPFAELARPLPVADLWQYNAILPPSIQFLLLPWELPLGKIMGTSSLWPPVLRWPSELADLPWQ